MVYLLFILCGKRIGRDENICRFLDSDQRVGSWLGIWKENTGRLDIKNFEVEIQGWVYGSVYKVLRVQYYMLMYFRKYLYGRIIE